MRSHRFSFLIPIRNEQTEERWLWREGLCLSGIPSVRPSIPSAVTCKPSRADSLPLLMHKSTERETVASEKFLHVIIFFFAATCMLFDMDYCGWNSCLYGYISVWVHEHTWTGPVAGWPTRATFGKAEAAAQRSFFYLHLSAGFRLPICTCQISDPNAPQMPTTGVWLFPSLSHFHFFKPCSGSWARCMNRWADRHKRTAFPPAIRSTGSEIHLTAADQSNTSCYSLTCQWASSRKQPEPLHLNTVAEQQDMQQDTSMDKN